MLGSRDNFVHHFFFSFSKVLIETISLSHSTTFTMYPLQQTIMNSCENFYDNKSRNIKIFIILSLKCYVILGANKSDLSSGLT